MNSVPVIERLNINQIERGQTSRFWLEMSSSRLGPPLRVPLLVARGWEDGPVVGVTAVVHGNSLNGLPVVRQLIQRLDLDSLRGAVVGIPVVNMPGFLHQQRFFLDDVDLNQVMPGRQSGNRSEVYTFRLVDRIVRQLDYLVDVQSADFGQVDAYFVRADTTLQKPAVMARLLGPQIILHDPGDEGTLRRAATELGIHSVTAVAGGPHRFQQDVILPTRNGLLKILVYLEMQEGVLELSENLPHECRRANWLYTRQAGVLEVFPEVGDVVIRGQTIGRLTNVFGDVLRAYTAPENGIVLSKTVNPVCQVGGRILYLGVPRQQNGRD